MNNALWSPRGAQARERTLTAGYTVLKIVVDPTVCGKIIMLNLYLMAVCNLTSSVADPHQFHCGSASVSLRIQEYKHLKIIFFIS